MKKILILFLFTACVNSTFHEESYRLLKEWIYADQIKIIAPNDELIERPPGGELLLFQLKLQKKSHCIYYLVPFKSQLGKLSVIENKDFEPCLETNQREAIVEINHLKKFKMTYRNFNLQISFEREGIQENLNFPLYNVTNGVIHQKYKSAKMMSSLPGLELINSPKKFIGNLDDRFSTKRALRCHQVNSRCETVGEYRCSECRYGWYEVSDYDCPQGGSKFCGQNHCGEKNEPACPRGHKLFQNEETGICQSDLLPVYNEDHILVCQ